MSILIILFFSSRFPLVSLSFFFRFPLVSLSSFFCFSFTNTRNVCHRLDLSCLEGFGALRTALSALFRVNSFNILYQTILDSGYLELTKDNGDDEKWLQFLAIVKKICVKPYSVTPQLKNLLS